MSRGRIFDELFIRFPGAHLAFSQGSLNNSGFTTIREGCVMRYVVNGDHFRSGIKAGGFRQHAHAREFIPSIIRGTFKGP
jgi:hypothetical protein